MWGRGKPLPYGMIESRSHKCETEQSALPATVSPEGIPWRGVLKAPGGRERRRRPSRRNCGRARRRARPPGARPPDPDARGAPPTTTRPEQKQGATTTIRGAPGTNPPFDTAPGATRAERRRFVAEHRRLSGQRRTRRSRPPRNTSRSVFNTTTRGAECRARGARQPRGRLARRPLF